MDLKINVYTKLSRKMTTQEQYLTNAIIENRRLRCNTRKEEAYREIYAKMYKLDHYRQFRKTLMNPEFRLRNLAVRCGVIRYDRIGTLIIGQNELAILIEAYLPIYTKEKYYAIDKKPDETITEINERRNSGVYEEESFKIEYNSVCHYYYIDYDGCRSEEDYYVYEEGDEQELRDIVYYQLTESGETILDYPIAEIRQFIKDEIKTYDEVQEESEPEEEPYECNSCPICYEEWSEEVEQKVFGCLHSICNSCLTHLRTRNCPICRESITVGNIVKVERTDEELEQLRSQESAEEICDTWFDDDDFQALIDHLGMRRLIGSDGGELIDIEDFTEFRRMYKQFYDEIYDDGFRSTTIVHTVY
jgi:hypothetical protein